MPDDDPRIFEHVMTYLYHGTFSALLNIVPRGDTHNPPAARLNQLRLLYSVYVMADRWGMEILCNAMIDKVSARFELWAPTAQDLQWLEDHTLPNDRMQMMVWAHVGRFLGCTIFKIFEKSSLFTEYFQSSMDAASKIMRTMLEYKEKPLRWGDLSACHWHRHDSTPVCGVGKKRRADAMSDAYL